MPPAFQDRICQNPLARVSEQDPLLEEKGLAGSEGAPACQKSSDPPHHYPKSQNRGCSVLLFHLLNLREAETETKKGGGRREWSLQRLPHGLGLREAGLRGGLLLMVDP